MKEVLITSSILILLIAALGPVLRGRIDPRMQYALWLIVALRLLVPVNFVTSAYSALALLDRAGAPSRIVETIGQTTIPARSYDSARAQVVEDYHQQGIADSALTPGDLMDIDARARELMKGPTLAELAQNLSRPIWLGGAALTAAWFVLVNLRLRRKLKGAVPVEADCPLPVCLSDALPSPCLCGVFRPAVYVTPAVLESPDRLRHVLAHELTHYRHRDHWWALLRCLCICLYWFDPLVWWAAALSRQDCELACDEGAIRTLGEGERIPYGRTLVAMIAAGRNPLLQTATTMTGGKRRIRERVALIARRSKTMMGVALALAVILACAVGCTFTGAPEGDPDPTASREPEPIATQTVLETEGVDPYAPEASAPESAQQAIRAVADELLAAPSVELTLALAGSGKVYTYPAAPSEDINSRLAYLPTDFRWEEAPYSASDTSDSLRIALADGSVSLSLSDGSYLVLVERDGEGNCYKGYVPGMDHTPYDFMRAWFYEAELSHLRVTSVPDRGQSHEDVVKEWIEGYEGAMTKCAPGGICTCTYIRAADVRIDQPEEMTREWLENFAQNHDLSADDFGKTWFTFSYSLIFVPENRNAKYYLEAGNTEDYTGSDAPEGAMVWSRLGIMRLIDGKWVCDGTVTGW